MWKVQETLVTVKGTFTISQSAGVYVSYKSTELCFDIDVAKWKTNIKSLRPRISQFKFTSFLANISGTARETRSGCIALGFRWCVPSGFELEPRPSRRRREEGLPQRAREREKRKREREKERERERERETQHTIHFFLVKVWGRDVAKSTGIFANYESGARERASVRSSTPYTSSW